MTESEYPTDQLQHCPDQWYQCTGFQRDLLLAIISHEQYNHDPYGLALQEWLQTRYPQNVTNSRVYTNLGDLADRGLIHAEPLSEHKNAYRLTDTGTDCLAAHGRLVDVLELPYLRPGQLGETDSTPGGDTR